MAEPPPLQIPTPIPSDAPPAVRVIRESGLVARYLLAQLSELLALALATYLVHIGKLSSTEWLGAMGFCLSGNVTQKTAAAIRGRMPMPPIPPTLVLVGAALGWLALSVG